MHTLLSTAGVCPQERFDKRLIWLFLDSDSQVVGCMAIVCHSIILPNKNKK